MANTTAITTKRKDFNNNTGLPDTTNKSGEELLAAMWGLTSTKTKQVSNISKVYYTKHGMFASIPILCRGVDCAYKDVCMVDPSERTVGSRCPMEIAALITRFNQWCQHFGINIDGETTIQKQELIETDNLHGTGCNLSAAITAYLANDNDLYTSILKALDYVYEGIENGNYGTLIAKL